MSERVALITGAGRGLGRVMTLALLRAGHRVFLTSTDRASLEETRRAANAGSDRTALATADLADERNLAGLVEAAEKAFGRIDILVNNAAAPIPRVPTPLELELGQIRRLFEINTFAPIRLTQLVAPAMIRRGWGRIVFISTSLDTMLNPAYTAYGMTKASCETYVSALAETLAGSGVTVNALLPGGATATRLTAGPDGALGKGMLSPDIMAAPIAWLASDASDGITGRRFIAARWNANLTDEQVAQAAGGPAAWGGHRDTSIKPAV